MTKQKLFKIPVSYTILIMMAGIYLVYSTWHICSPASCDYLIITGWDFFVCFCHLRIFSSTQKLKGTFHLQCFKPTFISSSVFHTNISFIFRYADSPLAITLLRALVKWLVSGPYWEFIQEMNMVGQIAQDKVTPQLLFSVFGFLSLPQYKELLVFHINIMWTSFFFRISLTS